MVWQMFYVWEEIAGLDVNTGSVVKRLFPDLNEKMLPWSMVVATQQRGVMNVGGEEGGGPTVLAWVPGAVVVLFTGAAVKMGLLTMALPSGGRTITAILTSIEFCLEFIDLFVMMQGWLFFAL